MAHQFDELAKALARGLSRRELLSRLAGGIAGGLLGSLGFGRLSISPAWADEMADCLRRANEAYAACRDAADTQYTKDLGEVREAFLGCIAQCASENGPERRACEAACTDKSKSDMDFLRQNHDAAVDACRKAQDDAKSECRAECQSNDDCEGGLVCITQGVTKRCVRCRDDSECQNSSVICAQDGTCVTCPDRAGAGTTACVGACIDPDTDPLNCGGCAALGEGTVCTGDQECVAGQCTTVCDPPCTGGAVCCNGQCCPAGQTCLPYPTGGSPLGPGVCCSDPCSNSVEQGPFCCGFTVNGVPTVCSPGNGCVCTGPC